MNCTIQFGERHVIPRWKSLHETLVRNELSNVRKIDITSENPGLSEYEQARIQWEINKNNDFVLSCFDSERNLSQQK